MTTNQTIDGVPRKALVTLLSEPRPDAPYGVLQARAELLVLLDEPSDKRAETVPKHKFDTLVQHCKRLEGDIAQARAHVNEITLYQQNAVWFWQHDGEDFLESLSCPIIIQPHHLRELLKGVVPAAQPHGDPVAKAKPVAKLHAERLTGRDGEYGVTVEDSQWFNTCRLTGGIFNLYAEQPAPVAVVLPERLTAAELEELEVIEALIHGQGLSNLAGTMAAARQFIDEVTRLNSVRPTHANTPPGTEPCGTHPHNDGLDEMRK